MQLTMVTMGRLSLSGHAVTRRSGEGTYTVIAPVSAAAIFGSWAARALGEAGPSPVDIDLVVIGRPDRDDLHDAVGRARSRLGRDINTVVISASRWRADGDPFLAELRSRPLVPLPGIPGPDDLAVSR